MKWGRRMDMVDAWSPAEDSDLKVWDLLSLCLTVSKSGCIPFYLTSFSHENSRADYLPCPLNSSNWSRTSAELPHEVHCTLGSAGNLMTHPAIYGYCDPQAWEPSHTLVEEFNPSVMGKENEFHQTEFEILKFC
ncbi:hypothetical protein TNCV_3417941 [Trichonephila clavipes]|nr:hypothetical protein TNCV_3417941 [Trichonephila clavipes]